MATYATRLRDRLPLWKIKYLTNGGKLVLIKSTLESIPVYMYSVFVMPASVIKEIERIVRYFLWGALMRKGSFSWSDGIKFVVRLNLGGSGLEGSKK